MVLAPRTLAPRTLAMRFLVAGGLVLVVAAALIGLWVGQRIEQVVVRNTSNATALYMDSVIAPLTQDLAQTDTLSPVAQRAVEELFAETPLGQRVISYKLRNRAGEIVASSDPTILGQTLPTTPELQRAMAGEVVGSFEDLEDDEDEHERLLGVPLLEIYSPVRGSWTGEVIGTAEFYEVATELKQDIARVRRLSWITVVAVLAGIGSALYLIVLQGSRTIARQVAELQALSRRNTALRLRVQRAAARGAAFGDRQLRSLGADLHDGPAQLMGFAALRLDSLRRHMPGAEAQAEIDAIAASVTNAMREIRDISRGLSLPDLEQRRPCEFLGTVAEAHRLHSGTAVGFDCGLPDDLPLSLAQKVCLYRFAQEGLANATRHGGGVDQHLSTRYGQGRLSLRVCDRGPGLRGAAPLEGEGPAGGGMGLDGLRDRVESLGGTLTLRERGDGQGAELVMELEVRE